MGFVKSLVGLVVKWLFQVSGFKFLEHGLMKFREFLKFGTRMTRVCFGKTRMVMDSLKRRRMVADFRNTDWRNFRNLNNHSGLCEILGALSG